MMFVVFVFSGHVGIIISLVLSKITECLWLIMSLVDFDICTLRTWIKHIFYVI